MKVFYFTLFLAAALSANAQNGFDSQSGNVLDALSGRLAGVNVINYSGDPTSKGPAVYINGLRSLNGGYPLIVVDGIIYEGDVSSINPNDVENVSVYTSAVGLVKYGGRAQYGVLEIKTKKGSDAKRNGALNFRGKWGVNSNAIGQYELLNRDEQYDYYERTSSGFLGDLTVKEKYGSGKDINYYDYFYTNSLRQEYNVDYSKTFKKGNVFASVGYLENGGIFKGNDNSRITARVNAEFSPKTGMRFGVNTSFAYLDRIKSCKDEDLLKMQANNPLMKDEFSGAYYRNYKYDGSEKVTSTAFSGKVYADVELTDELSIDANIAYLLNSPERKSYWFKGDQSAFHYLERFCYFDYQSDSIYASERTYSYSPELKLRWRKDWNTSGLTLTGGVKHYSYNVDHIEGIDIYRVGVQDGIHEHSENLASEPDRDSYNSLYASAYYYFMKGIHVEANVNRQSSDITKKYKNERWYTNWSVGAGCQLLDVLELPNSCFESVYLSADYGVIGNDRFNSFASGPVTMNSIREYLPWVMTADAASTYSIMSHYYESDIWEKNRMFNVNLSVSASNRLSGGVGFFYNSTSELLGISLIQTILGDYFPDKTIDGVVSNTGVNFWFTANPKINKLDWKMDLRLSHYKNKVSDLYGLMLGYNKDGYYLYGRKFAPLADGDDMSSIYLPMLAGTNSYGDPLLYSNEQKTETIMNVNGAYAFNRGSNTPDLFGGLTNTLSYGNFDLSCSLSFQIGGKVFDANYYTMMSSNLGSAYASHKDAADLCGQDGYSYIIIDKSIVDASYLSINKLSFGYKLPKKTLKPLHMKALRIYADADNLAIFTARKGMDPRCLSFTGASTYTGYYPMMRTVSVGVEAAF